jgi:hypothetical protein
MEKTFAGRLNGDGSGSEGHQLIMEEMYIALNDNLVVNRNSECESGQS